MTPRLRTLRATALAGAVGAAVLLSPGGAYASVAGRAPVPVVAGDPHGSEEHDGRGGHARPRHPEEPEEPRVPREPQSPQGNDRPHRPERPEPAERQEHPEPTARPHTRPGPTGGDTARDSATPSPSPSRPAPSRTAPPAPEPSRAGSLPGEGRKRPGRVEERRPDENIVDTGLRPDTGGEAPVRAPATAVPPKEAAHVPSPSPSQPRPGTRAGVVEPMIRVLPLGSGLVLIGLGLALAFVGLRLRRA